MRVTSPVYLLTAVYVISSCGASQKDDRTSSSSGSYSSGESLAELVNDGSGSIEEGQMAEPSGTPELSCEAQFPDTETVADAAGGGGTVVGDGEGVTCEDAKKAAAASLDIRLVIPRDHCENVAPIGTFATSASASPSGCSVNNENGLFAASSSIEYICCVPGKEPSASPIDTASTAPIGYPTYTPSPEPTTSAPYETSAFFEPTFAPEPTYIMVSSSPSGEITPTPYPIEPEPSESPAAGDCIESTETRTANYPSSEAQDYASAVSVIENSVTIGLGYEQSQCERDGREFSHDSIKYTLHRFSNLDSLSGSARHYCCIRP